MAEEQGAPSSDGRQDEQRTSREEAMKQMAERRRETVQQDMDPDDAEAFRAATEAKPEADKAETAAVGDAPAQDAAAEVDRQMADVVTIDDADLAKYRVRRKVNGVETMVGLDELRASAQKNDAADEYLAKAKATLAEMDSVVKQARAMAAPAQQDAAPTETRDQTDAEDPIDAAVDHLFGGDETKAKEALRKALARQTTTASEPDQLARSVEQRVVIRSALRQFAKDHRDIAADPTLRNKADEFLYQELANRGAARLEDLDPDAIPEVISAAGAQTKDWLRIVAGVPTAPQPQATGLNLDERKRAKQGIDELPTASVRSSSVITPPRTTTDTIAAMAAARNPMANPRAS